jgi:hypothetical protein
MACNQNWPDKDEKKIRKYSVAMENNCPDRGIIT